MGPPSSKITSFEHLCAETEPFSQIYAAYKLLVEKNTEDFVPPFLFKWERDFGDHILPCWTDIVYVA